MIPKPIRATVGNPRCAPVYPSTGTQIVPEFQRFLDELGITYRQWSHWRRMGYLPKLPWHEIANDSYMRQWAEDLAEAARLHAMTLPQLADHLTEERQAYDTL